MTSSEMLLTIAELSLALAGFSGVVVGFSGTRLGAVARQDRFGLVHILTSSGGALVFSLLPFALHAAGLSASAAQTATALPLGAAVLITSVAWGFATGRAEPRYPKVFWAFIGSGVVIGAALVVTSAGLFAYDGSLLPLTLLWLLLVGFTQFCTFLALIWFPDHEEGSEA